MVAKRPDFSVIIATRNRAESLRETLAALARQETGGVFTYEVLVVDNGSTDFTAGVVKELQATFPVPLRYLYEGRQGKPLALNAGLRQAEGQLFAFTDDDVLPTPTWLATLWRCFDEEEADGVAGQILPRWLVPRPTWLTDEAARRLISGMGCVDHGLHRLSSLDGQNCGWVGGNMAIRRAVISQVGGYDPRMVRAEDTEYYYRCVRHGLRIVYEPTALVYHKIWPERMNPAYLRWWHHTTGYYHAYFRSWETEPLVTIMPIWWYRKTLRFGVVWVVKLLAGRPWLERFWRELVLREHFSFGLHRLQLWPRWCWAVLTGRMRLP